MKRAVPRPSVMKMLTGITGSMRLPTAPAPPAGRSSVDAAGNHQVPCSTTGTLCLRLYVAGQAPNSVRAIATATALCREHFPSTHQLEIVDVLSNPSRASADGIIVTPTLIKLSPSPVRRVIGNLSDTPQVLLALVSR
jgi:circadian clock protein KaiB